MIDRLLVLRTCAADGTSHRGFRWPLEVGAVVEAPDWDADPSRDCGGGLHGLPWGLGNSELLSWESDAAWLVVEVDLAAGCVGSADKCRFRRGTVLHVGDRLSATHALTLAGASGPVVGAFVTGGYRSTVTGGDGSTVTGGDRSILSVRWWDEERYRLAIGYVGEDGIEPGVPYRVRNGKLVRA